jgi:hypothetical protein
MAIALLLLHYQQSQGEGCCIIVRDRYLSCGSTEALNCFLTQKSVSRMTRGRSRKRHQSSRKSTGENDHSKTGQGEEIATPPARCTNIRRGRPEEFTKMNPRNTGHGRQNPSVNSKKKLDSEEEEEKEKEEEEEEEEEDIATALDSKEVSHVHVDTDACEHFKQGLESEIPPETQNDPESEVSDGCVPSKKALDKTEVSHKNFDIDENDQTKQGPEQEIGTENQQGPESEVTKGGDTFTNKPGNSICTRPLGQPQGDTRG